MGHFALQGPVVQQEPCRAVASTAPLAVRCWRHVRRGGRWAGTQAAGSAAAERALAGRGGRSLGQLVFVLALGEY